MKNRILSAYHDTPTLWKNLLTQGLTDDGWPWDWTSLGIHSWQGRPGPKVHAQITAKAGGVWAAEGLVSALPLVAKELGGTIAVSRAKGALKNGQIFTPGTVVCEWKGGAREILALERPFLNLASYTSGIATQTRRLVEIVTKACPKRTPRVTATRKTLPGYRDLAIHGVLAGGGHSHRVSLSGGVLIKENHIASAGGIGNAITSVRALAPHLLKIEIEVRTLAELKQALRYQADVVMLDNFNPAQIRAALKIINAAETRPVLEVSGGLNESNIAEFAIEGVDILSIGSLTHSVRAVDLSLLIVK